MGERLHGMQEVMGSNPTISIKKVLYLRNVINLREWIIPDISISFGGIKISGILLC